MAIAQKPKLPILALLEQGKNTKTHLTIIYQMIGVEWQKSILNSSYRKGVHPISSSVESDQEVSDNDGVNGDEEATAHLGSRAGAGAIEESSAPA